MHIVKRELGNKFYNLLNQTQPDVEEIVDLVKYGVPGRWWWSKNKSIGLFREADKDNNTAFLLLAKQGNLSYILTVIFENILSIVERETGELVHIDEDLAFSFVMAFCLKNNRDGHNALSYSVIKRKYDTLDTLIKFCSKKTNYNALDKVKEYLGKIDTVKLDEIVSTSITSNYTDWFNFLFEFLKHSEQHHKIPKLIVSIKQQNIILDEGKKNHLTQLCRHSGKHFLELINIEKNAKNKIVTLIDNPLKYGDQFKNQFPYVDVSLEEYILDNLCEQYLNNAGDFQLGNTSSLLSMLDEYNDSNFTKVNISHTQRQTCVFMDSPKKNINENNLFFSDDNLKGFASGIVVSAISLLCYHLIKTLYYKGASTADSKIEDSNTVSTNLLTIESQISRPLHAGNFKKFFEDELSRVKALADSSTLEDDKFYTSNFGKKLSEFANSNAYTDDLKAQLAEMLNENYKKNITSYGNYKTHISKIAEKMQIPKPNKVIPSQFSKGGSTTQHSASVDPLGVVNESTNSTDYFEQQVSLSGDIQAEDQDHT